MGIDASAPEGTVSLKLEGISTLENRHLQPPSHHLLSVIPQDAMDSTTPRANHEQKTDGSDSSGKKS